jgi:hypothetical protein
MIRLRGNGRIAWLDQSSDRVEDDEPERGTELLMEFLA